MLEVVTFGNNVGGVKEVDDGMIGNDLDEMGKVEGVENKNVGKNESDEEMRENGERKCKERVDVSGFEATIVD
nr:hypothetical protein Itr_chr14CG13230 [Ipomoea trifida]